MSEEKFTPGPWFVADWDNDFGDNLLVIETRLDTGSSIWPDGIEKRQVADLREGSFSGNEALANARLIAAAPEGLRSSELLDGLCAWLLHRFGPDTPEGREALARQSHARAAIAKARGDA